MASPETKLCLCRDGEWFGMFSPNLWAAMQTIARLHGWRPVPDGAVVSADDAHYLAHCLGKALADIPEQHHDEYPLPANASATSVLGGHREIVVGLLGQLRQGAFNIELRVWPCHSKMIS